MLAPESKQQNIAVTQQCGVNTETLGQEGCVVQIGWDQMQHNVLLD